MEYKELPIELKDVDLSKGEAVIRHAVYDSLDLVKDISREGMFTKSWNETKMTDGFYDIDLYYNHKSDKAWGTVKNVFETKSAAFTHAKAGTHTLGVDVMKMLDEKIIRKASFGFIAKKAKRLNNGARELKEVVHPETSVLSKISAHPDAGIAMVRKSFEGLVLDIKSLSDGEQQFLKTMIGSQFGGLQGLVNFASTLDPTSDLYMYSQYWITRMSSSLEDMKSQLRYNVQYKSAPSMDAETKAHIDNMRKFVRNSTASDETLAEMDEEIKSFENSLVNTAITPPITEPVVSGSESEEKAFAESLLLFTLNL